MGSRTHGLCLANWSSLDLGGYISAILMSLERNSGHSRWGGDLTIGTDAGGAVVEQKLVVWFHGLLWSILSAWVSICTLLFCLKPVVGR